MYRVTKHGDTFHVSTEHGVAIVLGPASGAAYDLFLRKYNMGFTPCDAAFDRWLSEEPCSVADLLNMCSVRNLRVDELLEQQPTTSKPPVGLPPRSVWLASCAEVRIASIVEAVQRYMTAYLPIPQDWLEEYNEHCTKLKGS